MSEVKTVTMAGVSVKAQFVVVVGTQPYPVVVRYEPNEFVAEVKELIVAELKTTYDGFESVKDGYLTLKTLDGSLIAGTRIPEGQKFFADLDERLVEELAIPHKGKDFRIFRIQYLFCFENSSIILREEIENT
jgi:hypothetical protein